MCRDNPQARQHAEALDAGRGCRTPSVCPRVRDYAVPGTCGGFTVPLTSTTTDTSACAGTTPPVVTECAPRTSRRGGISRRGHSAGSAHENGQYFDVGSCPLPLNFARLPPKVDHWSGQPSVADMGRWSMSNGRRSRIGGGGQLLHRGPPVQAAVRTRLLYRLHPQKVGRRCSRPDHIDAGAHRCLLRLASEPLDIDVSRPPCGCAQTTASPPGRCQ